MEQHLKQPCDCHNKHVSIYHDPKQSGKDIEIVLVVVIVVLPKSESIKNGRESTMKLET